MGILISGREEPALLKPMETIPLIGGEDGLLELRLLFQDKAFHSDKPMYLLSLLTI
jgi:hypothetical protein